MSVIAHQTQKEWISSNEKSRQEWHKHRLRAQQSNIQPDLRRHICEYIIRALQHQTDVNQKQHICVKHDFVVSNITITVTLHSGTTQWTTLGSGSMFSFTQCLEAYPYCNALEFKGETKKEYFVPLKKLNCLNSENHRAIKNFAC
ncbi:hypothetical protein TNCV_3266531 [Trichonephila clavipes]|nr:hypothetical protein TNCV_3266531 [Trichonephila clavipes]